MDDLKPILQIDAGPSGIEDIELSFDGADMRLDIKSRHGRWKIFFYLIVSSRWSIEGAINRRVE
jgi:hypothetical protein